MMAAIQSLKFAYVRYIKENTKEIVRLHQIRNFKPKNSTDFNPLKVYLVRWDDIDTDSDSELEAEVQDSVTAGGASNSGPASLAGDPKVSKVGGLYKAQILKLGYSREELSSYIDNTRIRCPKVMDTSVELSSDEEVQQLSVSQIGKDRKEKKKKGQTVLQESYQQILREKTQTRKRLFPAGTSDRQSSSSNQKRTASTASLPSNESPLVRRLKRENVEYRRVNLELQKLLLQKFGCSLSESEQSSKSTSAKKSAKKSSPEPKRTDVISSPGVASPGIPSPPGCAPSMPSCAPSVPSTTNPSVSGIPPPLSTPLGSDEEELYSEHDGKVFIGCEIFLSKSKWDALQRQQKDSLFVKSLAVAVWGSATLKDRSVAGKLCPRFLDRSPKKPLTPEKLSVVRRCFEDRLDGKHDRGRPVSAADKCEALSHFNRYINGKIQDINRVIRRKEQKD